jgi:G3E family GTPase
MQVADCIVATKSDVTDAADKTLLDNYLCSLQLSNVKRVNTQNGEIDWQLLLGPSGFGQNPKSMKNHQTLPHTSMLASPRVSKANSPVKVSNKGQGYYSYGWVMPPDREYAYQRVIEAIDTIDVERLKAILITDAGIHSFNLEGKALTCLTLNYAADSRLELITNCQSSAEKAAAIIDRVLQLS